MRRAAAAVGAANGGARARPALDVGHGERGRVAAGVAEHVANVDRRGQKGGLRFVGDGDGRRGADAGRNPLSAQRAGWKRTGDHHADRCDCAAARRPVQAERVAFER